MRERCIFNFDTERLVVLYNPDTRAYQEIARDQLPAGRTIGLGAYVNVAEQVVGVYPTPSGPVCFHNRYRYPLKLGSWDATVTSEDEHDITKGRNIWTLFHEGQKAFAIAYAVPLYRYYDPWSICDEDVDFFLWLKSGVGDQRFHTVYTQEWHIGRADIL